MARSKKRTWRKLVSTFSGFFLLNSFMAAIAEEVAVPHPEGQSSVTPNNDHGAFAVPAGVALDLSTQTTSLASPNASPVSVLVGGSLVNGVIQGAIATSFQPGQMVTPAQYAAISQAISGAQTLVLDHSGSAIGGYLNIASSSINHLHEIVVPANVSLNSIGYTSANPLNVAGTASILGSMFALQSSPGVSSVLNFGNLNIAGGGLLSGALPMGAGNMSGLFQSGALAINVAGTLNNAGVIYSPGALDLNVAGAINNTGLISALNNLSIASAAGNITNSGTISSALANINLTTQIQNNLTLNNVAGVFSALNGAVNVRDALYSEAADTTILGGDVLSRELNINGGAGIVEAQLKEVTGQVTTTAAAARILADTSTLTLGSIKIDGDPTFFNTGNISITGDIITNEKLAILAGGDITSTSGLTEIRARDASGQGFDIHIIAGASLSGGATSTPSLPGSAATASVDLNLTSIPGGSIDLSNSTNLQINANSTSGNLAGANVTLAAFANGATGGRILLAPGSTINTGASGSGANGNISVFAGASSGTSISLGDVNAAGGATTAPGTGNVLITTAQPTTSNGAKLTFDVTGAITSGNRLIASTTVQNASISTGSIFSRAGVVSLTAGQNLLTGCISADAGANASGGGAILLNTTSSTAFTIGAGASVNGVNGTLSAAAGTISGAGGFVIVANKGTGGITVLDTAAISVASNTGFGGTIDLNGSVTGSVGPLTIAAGILSVDGTGTGNGYYGGGTINLKGSSLSITGGGPLLLSANGAGSGAGGTIQVTTTSASSDIRIGSGAGELMLQANGGTGSLPFAGPGGLLFDPSGGTWISERDQSLSWGFAIPVFGQGAVTSGEFTYGTLALGYSGPVFVYDFNSYPRNSGVTSIAAWSFGYPGPGGTTSVKGGAGQYVITAQNYTYNSGEVYNAQTAVLGSANSLGLASGSLVLSYGAMNVIQNNHSVGINKGDGVTSQTLFPLGIGSSTGRLSAAQMNELSGRAFAFTPNALGSYNVMEIKPGTAGTISVSAGRNLIIDATSVAALPAGAANRGGSYSFSAGAGGSGTITLNGVLNANGSSFGGTVNLSYRDTTNSLLLNILGDINAKATATGSGGTVTINNLAGDTRVNLAGIIDVSSAGTTQGLVSLPGSCCATAKIDLSGTGRIVGLVDLRGASVKVDFTGAANTLKLRNVSSTNGSINIANTGTGSLVQLIGNAVTAVGGSLTINTRQFDQNGIEIKANGTSGAAGAIILTSPGDLSMLNPGTITVAANSNGAGGSIQVLVPNGTLSTPNRSFLANASGTGNFGGGSITILAQAVSVTGTGDLFLSANAIGTGSGGTVSFTTTGAASDILIGPGAGKIQISALGGASGSSSGDGGQVTVSAGRNLTIDPAGILANPRGTTGKGAILDFSAGNNLLITANLDASSAANGGAGGSIRLSSGSSTTFVVGGATTNGSIGTLTARGATAGAGAGGTVRLVTTAASISLPVFSNINVAAGSSGGAGGTIELITPVSHSISLPSGTLSADAVAGGNYNGGNITLESGSLSVAGNLAVSANAKGSGNGGQVSIKLASDISLGLSAGEIAISATGGSSSPSSSTGNGGNVTVWSAGNLIINSGAISASPLGTNGNGAVIDLKGGTDGSGGVTVNSGAVLNALPVGSGTTGNLKIESADAITIQSGASLSAVVTQLTSLNETISSASVVTGRTTLTIQAFGDISTSGTARFTSSTGLLRLTSTFGNIGSAGSIY